MAFSVRVHAYTYIYTYVHPHTYICIVWLLRLSFFNLNYYFGLVCWVSYILIYVYVTDIIDTIILTVRIDIYVRVYLVMSHKTQIQMHELQKYLR